MNDAILFACGANASHGLLLTNADKRQAVLTLLGDPEWRKWTDNKVAEAAGVSQPFVSEQRRAVRELITVIKSSASEAIDEMRTGRDGKSYPAKKSTPARASGTGTKPSAAPPDLDLAPRVEQTTFTSRKASTPAAT